MLPALTLFQAPPRFASLTESSPNVLVASVWELFKRDQVEPDLATLVHIAAASTVVSLIFDVARPGGGVSPIAVYLGIDAASGAGKTAAERHAFAAIREFDSMQRLEEPKRLLEYHAQIAGWRAVHRRLTKQLDAAYKFGDGVEEVQALIAEHEATKPKRPRTRQLIRNKTTLAGILNALQGIRESIALSADEGGVLLDRNFLELIAYLTQFWSGSALGLERGNNASIHIQDPRVTVTFMIQDGVLQRFMRKYGDYLRESGFLARLLVYKPRSNIGERFWGPAEADLNGGAEFQQRLRDLLSFSHCLKDGERIVLEFDSYAQRRWFNYANEFEQAMAPGGYLHEATDVGSKAMDQVTRLAAIFHVISNKEGLITVESLERAYYFYRFCLEGFMQLFATPRDILDARQLVPLMNQAYRRGVLAIPQSWFLNHGPQGTRNAKALNAAISRLEMEGAVWVGFLGRRRFVNLKPEYFCNIPAWVA